ncbi:MAG: hypothetical protein BWY99_00352 [Synergistetes bacterium ADurb.BinA166]|nr:MAG: hypothetical protein BWY99_00352 [Synergistetes bacterium ADurb.BinA166]
MDGTTGAIVPAMPIIVQLIIGLAVAGTVVYLFNSLWTTIDPRFKTAINALIGLGLFFWVLYCLSALFGWGWFGPVGPGHRAFGC